MNVDNVYVFDCFQYIYQSVRLLIKDSISSGCFGHSEHRLYGPVAVTSMLSSIRIPSPRKSFGTVVLVSRMYTPVRISHTPLS